MIVLLNGPLGIGKSTLAEALVEHMDGSVMLDGDALLALNPGPPNEIEYLHRTIALLVDHHRHSGYRHVVIDHIWRSPAEIADLRARLGSGEPFRCFLLTLPAAEHVARIERRACSRALDERDFDLRTHVEERTALAAFRGTELGEPFDVGASPEELVARMLALLSARTDVA